MNKGHFIDRAWKRVLSEGIDDAIAFFLPALAKDRDVSREIETAKDEFPAFDSETDKGMRIADLCFSVPIKSGESRKVGLFIEQQHEDDEEFAVRMFQTFYRQCAEREKQRYKQGTEEGILHAMGAYQPNSEGISY
ncbi:hypothetical protein FACS1894167_06220 [Synergistales bacterium]|nr:hypothetical protein FACS1894167_06220 [Synergistales bacterium]